jgi:drug/metabolite transporter (DMT)-like permease
VRPIGGSSVGTGPPEGTRGAGPRARWEGAGLLLVVLTAAVSGVSTFVNAYAVSGTGSDAFVTLRNLAVVGLLVPLAVLGGRAARAPLRAVDWGRLTLIGVLGGAVPFLLFFRGLSMATAEGGAVTAAFGYRTLFLMAGVLAVVVLRERLPLRWLAAAVLLLAGNALLLAWTSPLWTDGTAYVLAATCLWAVEYTVSKRTLRDLPSSVVGLGRMGFGAAILVGYLTVTGAWTTAAGFSAAQWSWVVLSALLLAAFVATWYAGLARTDLSVASAALVLGFPITWALSLALAGAHPSLVQAAGVVGIVLGVVTAVGAARWRSTAAWVSGALGRHGEPTG